MRVTRCEKCPCFISMEHIFCCLNYPLRTIDKGIDEVTKIMMTERVSSECGLISIKQQGLVTFKPETFEI